jgi:hypothetical protein
MKARILITATLATTFAGILPAVDQHLLNLVMPDAKVLAGVNVVSAKNSPFGQYVLSQMPNNQEFQKMSVLVGFDPRQDLIELLAASNGSVGNHQGLALATGTFNTGAITAAATLAGAKTESYHGATIVSDPNPKATVPAGIAFLGTNIVLAGDIADVKAAIDRQSAPSTIDSGLASQASILSGNQDAWFVSLVPPPAIKATPTGKGAGTNGPAGMIPATALQQIVSGSGGVKFGTNVVVTAQAQADNAEDANTLAGMMQLLANMAKMQADKNPQAASLANALNVTASGTNINITFTLAEDQLQKLAVQGNSAKKPAVHGAPKK